MTKEIHTIEDVKDILPKSLAGKYKHYQDMDTAHYTQVSGPLTFAPTRFNVYDDKFDGEFDPNDLLSELEKLKKEVLPQYKPDEETKKIAMTERLNVEITQAKRRSERNEIMRLLEKRIMEHTSETAKGKILRLLRKLMSQLEGSVNGRAPTLDLQEVTVEGDVFKLDLKKITAEDLQNALKPNRIGQCATKNICDRVIGYLKDFYRMELEIPGYNVSPASSAPPMTDAAHQATHAAPGAFYNPAAMTSFDADREAAIATLVQMLHSNDGNIDSLLIEARAQFIQTQERPS